MLFYKKIFYRQILREQSAAQRIMESEDRQILPG